MGDVKQVHSPQTMAELEAYNRGRRDAYRNALADLEMVLDNAECGSARKNLEHLARDIRACIRELT